MAYIKVVVPTPHQHPGWVDHFFVTTGEAQNWLQFYHANVEPAPERGQAWDTTQRAMFAAWKQRFVEWLAVQDGVKKMILITM